MIPETNDFIHSARSTNGSVLVHRYSHVQFGYDLTEFNPRVWLICAHELSATTECTACFIIDPYIFLMETELLLLTSFYVVASRSGGPAGTLT